MKVVILAGGMGTRMPEYTKTIPKPMVKINHIPMLIHIMQHYNNAGFNEFYIALGYKGYVIKNYFKKKKFKWKVNLIETGINTMTGGRLRRLKKYLKNDRFFLSPTHYAMTLYSVLIETNRLGKNGLEQFNTDGSTIEMIGGEHSPGHETNGGSFGQTISQAAGVAWARRTKGDSGIVCIFLSDGECQEGQTWEAIMAMSFHKLNNLKIIVDANGQQVDGRTNDVMALRSLEAKFNAFGALSYTVDGHDIKELVKTLKNIKNNDKLKFLLS